MMDFELPVNGFALACDVACIAGVRARPQSALPITIAAGFLALFVPTLGVLLSDPGLFGAMRTLAWILFIHAPVVLFSNAAILRKHSRGEAGAQAVIGVLLIAVGVDAFVVEPRWLEVARYTVASPKITRPLRIVELTDIQTDDVGAWEVAAFERAMAEKPDLIVMPGDFLQIDVALERYPDQLTKVRALWPTLQAPLGVWAVQGNVDWRETWSTDLFDGTAITADRDTVTRDLGPVSLTSVDFTDSFDAGLQVAPTDDFHIAFGHGPDFSLSSGVQTDLLIAGHTHGGQVVVPGIGPLLTLSKVPRPWAAGGLTTLEGGRQLVVSRGIGMERSNAPRLRFNCRPQLVVIDLVPG